MDLTAKEQSGVVLDITAVPADSPPKDEAVINNRALKYSVAMGEFTPGITEIKKHISSGTDKQLREQLVHEDYFMRRDQTRDMLEKALSTGQFQPNEQDAAFLAAIGTVQPKNEATVMEEKYAENVLMTGIGMSPNEDVQKEYYEDPNFDPYLSVLQDRVAKTAIAQRISEDYTRRYDEQSWGKYLSQFAGQAIPLFQWGNFASPEVGFGDVGSSIQNKLDQLNSLPPAQFEQEARKYLAELESVNFLDAVKFSQALLSYGQSSEELDRLFTVLDVGTFAPVKALTGPARAAVSTGSKHIKSVAKNITKAASSKQTTLPQIIASTGDVTKAADMVALETVAKKFAGPQATEAQVGQIQSLLERTPTIFNPRVHVTDIAGAPATRASNMTVLLEKQIDKLTRAITTGFKPALSTDELLQEAYAIARRDYDYQFGSLSDAVVETKLHAPESNSFNLPQMEVVLGKQGGGYFGSENEAKMVATLVYKLKPSSYTIKEDAGVYSIRHFVDVSERATSELPASVLVEKLITTQNTSRNRAGTVAKKIAGAKEVVSDFQAQQRIAAVTAITQKSAIVAEEINPVLNKLTKKQLNDLNLIMKENRDGETIPGDPSTRGFFYETSEELNNAYMSLFNRPVTEAEELAYHSIRNLSDLDYLERSLREYTRKARLGHMERTFRVYNPETKKVEAVTVEAKLHDKLPRPRDSNEYLLEIDGNGNHKVVNLRTVDDLEYKRLNDQLSNEGWMLLNPENILDDVLRKTTGHSVPVSFVLTKGVRTDSLQLAKQVNYAPGFHVEYKAPYFVKMPQFVTGPKGRRQYIGDRVILAADSEAEAKFWSERLNEARRLHKNNDPELPNYLNKNTPWIPDDFDDLIKNYDGDFGFTAVPRGKHSVSPGVYKQEYGDFDNALASPYNDRAKAGDPFLAEKDAMLKKIENRGTEENPDYWLKDADQFNPLTTQRRTMGRLIRDSVYRDYQDSAIMSFVTEFSDVLRMGKDPIPLEELLKNPYYYFHHSDIVENAVGKDARRTAMQARQVKLAIQQLVGQPSAWARSVEGFVADQASRAFEGKFLGKLTIPERLMPFVSDPATYMRSFVTSLKLGMFNPVPMFVNANTFAVAMSVNPRYAASAANGSILMSSLSLTRSRKIFEHAADLAAKAHKSWTKQKFLESYGLWDQSGYSRIGGEYAWRAYVDDPRLFTGKARRALDKSFVFFNHSERAVRMNAWNMAYLEYAEKFPQRVGKMTAKDGKAILNRAGDLSGNMTRDANAFWQQGALSSFTQYYSYSARIAELALGTRLTPKARAQMVAGAAVLYGLPPVAGLGLSIQEGDLGYLMTSLNPFDEDLRSYALEHGVNLSEGTWGYINKGLIASMLQLATGVEFNVAERYAPYSVHIGETIAQNYDMYDNAFVAAGVSMLGASGSILGSILTTASPIMNDVNQILGGTGSTEVLANDIFNVLREISTVNNAYKAYMAWKGGMYLSKRGTPIDLFTKDEMWQKWAEGLSGLTDIREGDAFRESQIMKSQQEEERYIRKRVLQLLNEYMIAKRNGDETRAAKFRNQAEATLQASTLSPKQKSNIIVEGMSERTYRDIINESFIKQADDPEQMLKRKELIRETE